MDDVGFLVEIVNVLSKKYNIDQTSIFTAGMSNGGFMSSRLLCDRADVFSGGAILTASISKEFFPKCKPEKPVAVLVMNGTDDKLVPYDGGEIKVFNRQRGEIVSTDEYVEFWKERNGCGVKQPTVHLPDLRKFDGTTVSIDKYTDCETGGALVLYKINGGGHTWPSGKQYLGKRVIGNTSREVNACDEIWRFFQSVDR